MAKASRTTTECFLILFGWRLWMRTINSTLIIVVQQSRYLPSCWTHIPRSHRPTSFNMPSTWSSGEECSIRPNICSPLHAARKRWNFSGFGCLALINPPDCNANLCLWTLQLVSGLSPSEEVSSADQMFAQPHASERSFNGIRWFSAAIMTWMWITRLWMSRFTQSFHRTNDNAWLNLMFVHHWGNFHGTSGLLRQFVA